MVACQGYSPEERCRPGLRGFLMISTVSSVALLNRVPSPRRAATDRRHPPAVGPNAHLPAANRWRIERKYRIVAHDGCGALNRPMKLSCNQYPLPGMDTPCRVLLVASLLLISTAFTAFGVRGDEGSMPAKDANASVAATSMAPTSGGIARVLLFKGAGASPNDVAAIKTILNNNHLNYSTANSSQLNEMGESQIRGYRLLIVPGGNFIDIGNGLTSNATASIRDAVQNGLNYLGICAGGFFAGNSGYYNGLNLTSGVRFSFYSVEARGIRKAAVAIAVAEGPTLDQYWEDGPQFTGWGAVVGKYPDATPAIVEGTFGSGWVILTGVHPEAPAGWRHGMTFTTPVSVDNTYAATLIHAALNRVPLPHY
jgi:glutamine amidotransferase-like uncharacterized protein